MASVSQAAAERPIQRGWMPYATAAKLYVGIDPGMLLKAIRAHELVAYEKPVTVGRRPDAREYHSYFVCLPDVDDWIRTYWKPAFSD